MGLSNWKQRLGQVPVLGQLMRALRGVYSLPVWREDLRRDIAGLNERASGLAQQQQAQLERLAEVQQTVTAQSGHLAAQLARFDQSRMRQDDAVAGFAQRLHALEADLQHALRGVRQLQLHAVTGLGTPLESAPAGPAPAVVKPESLASMTTDEAEGLAPFAHLLQPLQAAADAQALRLHKSPPATWLTALGAQAGAGLAVIVALSGLEDDGAPPIARLLEAAQAALAPGGVCIWQMPNPENLSVVAELLLAGGEPRILAPGRAERQARQAGFGNVAVLRFGADEPAAGDAASGNAQWQRLLHGPRQYALVAHRAT